MRAALGRKGMRGATGRVHLARKDAARNSTCRKNTHRRHQCQPPRNRNPNRPRLLDHRPSRPPHRRALVLHRRRARGRCHNSRCTAVLSGIEAPGSRAGIDDVGLLPEPTCEVYPASSWCRSRVGRDVRPI